MALLERCPFCSAEVVFLSDTCPACSRRSAADSRLEKPGTESDRPFVRAADETEVVPTVPSEIRVLALVISAAGILLGIFLQLPVVAWISTALLLASTILHEKRITLNYMADVWSLFGLVPLRMRRTPISEFKGIRLWRDALPNVDQRSSYPFDPPFFDNWSVELVRH